MIEVERGPRPPFMDSPEFEAALSRWNRFHREGGYDVKQERLEFEQAFRKFIGEWREDLRVAFADKCAFTEVSLSRERWDIVHYWPTRDARSGREFEPRLFWQRAADWSNLYPARNSVVVAKETQCPTFSRLTDESTDGVLLDPCVDQPVWFLRFDDRGRLERREHPAAGTVMACHPKRGSTTIKMLRLNDRALVAERGRWLLAVPRRTELAEAVISRQAPFAGATRQLVARRLLAGEYTKVDASLLDELAGELAAEVLCDGVGLPDSAFGERVREAIHAHVIARAPLIAEHSTQWRALFGVDGGAVGPGTSKGVESGAPDELDARGGPDAGSPDADSDFESGESDAATPDVAPLPAGIIRVEIRNFKSIARLRLDFPPSSEEQELWEEVVHPDGTEAPAERVSTVPWCALLGENGCGKSTVLEAIVFGLSGNDLERVMKAADLQWRDLLRRGSKQGSIKITLDDERVYHLGFDAKGARWKSPPPSASPIVRAYGATRLLGGASAEEMASVHRRLHVGNLFDPRHPVIDAKRWLLGLGVDDPLGPSDERQFNAAALTLREFFEGLENRPRQLGEAESSVLRDEPLGETVVSERPMLRRDLAEKRIYLGDEPLRHLSDGFKSVVAMLCDIIAGFAPYYSVLREARGIVLIDEIGAHLHPRWRMTIARTLRLAIPKVQVIVSTHEPLCLRGFLGGEVLRMHRGGRYGVLVEQVDRSPSDYRVDQLLTSEFFGLDTTIDPTLDRQLQRYYELLGAERSRTLAGKELDPAERDELLRLRVLVAKGTGLALGASRRDQLVYEAIDAYLQQERAEFDEALREEIPDDLIGVDEDPATWDWPRIRARQRRERRGAAVKAVAALWRERSAVARYSTDAQGDA